MMNDGNGGDDFSDIDSSAFLNKPLLQEHTSFAAIVEGNTYVVYLKAYNVAGITVSESVAFVLASVPTIVD